MDRLRKIRVEVENDLRESFEPAISYTSEVA